MRELEGRTALVTGAASGIGLGMARTFAREGMSVVLCDIRGDRLDAALAEVRGLGKAIAVTTDVSDRASVRAAGEAAVNGASNSMNSMIGNRLILVSQSGILPADSAACERSV